MNRPQSTIVEEYWKFDYFTTFALGKKPSSGLYFKDVALSRSASENCQYAYVGVEMNGEFEAWYAQYLYTSSLPEYKNSKWERRDYSNPRREIIKDLENYIDKKGCLLPQIDAVDLELHILNVVIPTFRKLYDEEKYPYDYTREAIDNFKNIKKLTEGC